MNLSGPLRLGDIAAVELAEEYGTPLLVIDGDVLASTIERFVSAANGAGIEVAYAGKALLLVGLAQLIKHTALRLDVCSLGELATAQRAGFPPSRIDLHGCGKNEAELRAAAAGEAGRVIVDNLAELSALASYASATPINVLLRINSGIRARTHALVSTSGDQSKFGMLPDDFAAAANIFRANPALRFRGLHSHIGSQIFDGNAFIRNAARLVSAAAQLHNLHLVTSDVVAGGGFPVSPRRSKRSPFNLARTLAAISKEIRSRCAASGLASPKVGVEPGRALIAPAGTSLYRVMAKKQQRRRTFIIVDGGMADNPRPALYGARPDAKLAGRVSGAKLQSVTICGRSCENDLITESRLPEDVTVGDILAMPMAGAYTYSMASNYNRFSRPAVIYVRRGKHRLMARRDTLDDVLANDITFTGA